MIQSSFVEIVDSYFWCMEVKTSTVINGRFFIDVLSQLHALQAECLHEHCEGRKFFLQKYYVYKLIDFQVSFEGSHPKKRYTCLSLDLQTRSLATTSSCQNNNYLASQWGKRCGNRIGQVRLDRWKDHKKMMPDSGRGLFQSDF